MRTAAKYLLSAVALVASGVAPAMAADIYEPPVIETPIYQAPEVVPAPVSGWYLRGDVGYAMNRKTDAYYAIADTGPTLLTGSLFGSSFRGSYTVGGGVGYKFNHYLRGDVTGEWWGRGMFYGNTYGTCDFGGGDEPCTSNDTATFTALTLMANAYVDFGTYGRVTPYAGVGFGGAHVRWGRLRNEACLDSDTTNCQVTWHGGEKGWRFAYALMAGASVAITCDLEADFGYKYQRITGGRMFGTVSTAGFGMDKGITSHQVKGGLRYKLGGCPQPTPTPYPIPEPLPVYK